MFEIEFANRQRHWQPDEQRLVAAARTVLGEQQVTRATISLAVVDDPTIHALNRQYLQHDYPTDVLSFRLDDDPNHLNGEVVVSADTAARQAVDYGWRPDDELLLYVIHGILHLVGYDDKDLEDREMMRQQERHFLARFGLKPPGIARTKFAFQDETEERVK